ncbi:GNAT family N-acetyltransferase [Paenibacillus rhizovicinus]|uniref:GNAT family N-acetyltransferase n=1 Tax=Paenibacillus rhizovicinus TaxID=2704463 RepID=A0A6C0P9E5_9BACL|nr:GNAT family N-acetyltransferase [Paenibacillus rhizovicinus]
MVIREFHASDAARIVSLFYETVHAVNKRDYAQEQLDAWAPRGEEAQRAEAWQESMVRNRSYVAEMAGVIAGFADMTNAGHLDRLYVHKDYQRRGIASMLVNKLESDARELGLPEMDTEASITARPFFERRGYRVERAQTVERNSVRLDNFRMSKLL